MRPTAMTEYMYLECLSHDPPIRSREPVGHHIDALPGVRQMAASERVREDALMDAFPPRGMTMDELAEVSLFMEGHRGCVMGIVSEYGDHYPLVLVDGWPEFMSLAPGATLAKVRTVAIREVYGTLVGDELTGTEARQILHALKVMDWEIDWSLKLGDQQG